MKIFVCVKHVPDSAATIVVRDGNQIDEKITFLLNPYDEYAVTEAVELRKKLGDAEVIGVCLGPEDAEKTLRSAMAMGVDRGILIVSEKREDSITTARVLKSAIELEGDPGIIFTGKESIDMVGSQTMYRLGAALGFPTLNNVVKFSADIPSGESYSWKTGKVSVEALTEDGGKDLYEIGLPCILGAGRGLNNPAYPTFPDVVKARKREVRKIEVDELQFDVPAGKTEIVELELFARERNPRKIEGSSDSVANEIVRILKEEAKVI